MPPLTDENPSSADQALAPSSSFISPTEIQWDVAQEFFSNKPPGTKLYKGELYRDVDFDHCYMEIASQPIAMPSGKQPGIKLGEGNYGKVQQVILRDGRKHVLKIGTDFKVLAHEADVAQDLGCSIGMTKRHDSEKTYLHMYNLGQSLDKVLRTIAYDDHERRMDLSINILRRYVALHYGVLSTTKTPYAHLDSKAPNIAVKTKDDKNTKDDPYPIDWGNAKKYPSRLVSLLLCTYWFSPPPMSLLFNGIELDSVALERILFLPKRFLCAEGYVNHGNTEGSSLFTSQMMDIYEMHQHINTSIDYRATPESFYENRTSSLALTALLIVKRNKILFDYDNLKKDPWSCLLLMEADLKGQSAAKITRTLRKPYHFVRSSLPRRFRHLDNSVLHALFICAQIAPKVDLDKLATNPLAPACVKNAVNLELLPHLHIILNDPKLIFMLCQNTIHPEFSRVLKMILDESPEDKSDFRDQRLKWLYSNYTKIPASYNRHIEKALRIIDKHKLPYTFDQLLEKPELAIIIYKLKPFNLLQFLPGILEIPRLCKLIIKDKVHHHFFALLKEIFNGENGFSDSTTWNYYIQLLRTIPEVLEICERREATVIDGDVIEHLTQEQLDLIISYDELMVENTCYSHYLKQLLTATNLRQNGQYIGVQAANAVLQSQCDYPDAWIARIASTSKPQAGRIYSAAALYLKKQHADRICFDDLFAQLEASIDDLEALKTKLILLKQRLLSPENTSCLARPAFNTVINTLARYQLKQFIPLLFRHHDLLPILSALFSNSKLKPMAIEQFLTAFEELSISNPDSIQPASNWIYLIIKTVQAEISNVMIYKFILIDPIYRVFAHFIESEEQAVEYLSLSQRLVQIKTLAEQDQEAAQEIYTSILMCISTVINASPVESNHQTPNGFLYYSQIHTLLTKKILHATAMLQKDSTLYHHVELFINQSAQCAFLSQQPSHYLEQFSIFSPRARPTYEGCDLAETSSSKVDYTDRAEP